MDNIRNEIGELIKQARRQKKMSARELGERLIPPVTFAAVYGWESGNRMPNADTLLQISKILEIDVKSLLLKDNEPASNYFVSSNDAVRRDMAEFESCYVRMSDSQRRAVLAVASAMVESHPLSSAQDTPTEEAVEYSVTNRDTGETGPLHS